MLRTKADWLQNAYQDRTQCGVLRKENIGDEIYVLGWVFRYRDNGGVIFFDMRDHTGIVQVVFERSVDQEMLKLADSVRQEFVIAVKGKVRARGEGLANPKLATGDIEIAAEELIILNKSKTIPFSLEEFDQVGEETRLKHRYMDLRGPPMANMLRKRHELILAFRNYLNDQDFLEVETPILNKSTPEGARDFLVPSRMHPGEFYALPQSPQIFKQILMASGVNRYFQVVKCFRDEDLRADRQPEFTQLDIEMSFVDQEDLIGAIEKMWQAVWPKVFGFEVPAQIKRITYEESMRRFGVDRPDMRFGIELNDVADIVKDSDFKVFRTIVEEGGMVNAICVPGGAVLSRKDIDDLTSWLGKDFGAKGLAWLKHTDNGLESVIAKFFSEDQLKAISERLGTKAGDIVFFGAGSSKLVYASLGALRLRMAERFELTKWDDFNFVWVTDFPLLEEGDGGEWTSVHHPFTSPDDELLQKIQDIQEGDGDDAAKAAALEELRKNTDWAKVTSKSYDLVLNGHEIGGGSIRIHDTTTQDAVFQLLGMTGEDAELKFGFLLNALSYGAPPHGGIAFGVDRVLMLGLNFDSIRDVIAFPKTQKGICQMSQAPTAVGIEQLLELGIKLHRD